MPINSLETIATQFIDAWNAHDMTVMAALFIEEAEFVNVFGAWWTGRERIRAEHAAVHQTVFRQSTLSKIESRSRALTPEAAMLHWRWKLTGLFGRDGKAMPDRTGIMLFVLVERAGRWEIAAAQNTDTVPPPGG